MAYQIKKAKVIDENGEERVAIVGANADIYTNQYIDLGGQEVGQHGVNSLTIGNKNSARGTGAIATGSYTEATGNYSHAEGASVLGSAIREGRYEITTPPFSSNTIKIRNVQTNTSVNDANLVGKVVDLGQEDYYTLTDYYDTSSGYQYQLNRNLPSDWVPLQISCFYNSFDKNIASGFSSHSEGNGTKAEGEASHAEGVETYAMRMGSHAEGYETEAKGAYSHAEGNHTETYGNYSHAEGDNTTTGEEGDSTEGKYAHAEGSGTKALGQGSHAEGEETTTTGDYSHAEGKKSHTAGNYAHAEGDNTAAGGNYSHSEGDNTSASGNYSHVEGQGTVALGSHQSVIGKYNDANTDNIFQIGCGTSDNDRRNALYVKKNGAVITEILQLATNTNFNNITEPGTFYFTSVGADYTYAPNCNSNGKNGIANGFLDVIATRDRSFVKQIVYRQSTLDGACYEIWQRTQWKNTTEDANVNPHWGSWTRVDNQEVKGVDWTSSMTIKGLYDNIGATSTFRNTNGSTGAVVGKKKIVNGITYYTLDINVSGVWTTEKYTLSENIGRYAIDCIPDINNPADVNVNINGTNLELIKGSSATLSAGTILHISYFVIN